jgi:hypothetical protein
MRTMTRIPESTAAPASVLRAFELSERTWKLGFTTGRGQRPRVRQIPAGAVDRVADEITRANARFDLPGAVPVVSCYEAGREGYWLHRYLGAQGVLNYVVDSSSIEVNRRARRAKTDGLDLVGLLRLLERYVHGERRVWHVVRVPSVAEEDARHIHRLRETVQQERTRVINRLQGLLTPQGVRIPLHADFLPASRPSGDGMARRSRPECASDCATCGRTWCFSMRSSPRWTPLGRHSRSTPRRRPGAASRACRPYRASDRSGRGR